MHRSPSSPVLLALLTGACGGVHAASVVSDDAGADGTSTAQVEPAAVRPATPAARRTGGGAAGVEASAGASVLQFHKHVNRDGFFVDAKLTEASAATFQLDTTFSGTVIGHVYASPLYVGDGVNGKGTLYVATEAGTIFALDEATGKQVWKSNVGKPAQNSGAGCGNIHPIGITGTPAIDLATRLIVFDSASADSSGDVATHTIYGMSIDDGSVTWSVDVSTLTSGGTTFTPQSQNQRGAVLIVNGVAYVPYGGHYGDCSTYHGWVVGVPLSGTGAQGWATTVPGAGIWGVGGPASDGTSIFVTTGNGFDSNRSWAESEGLFRLDPGPTFSGQTADYFVPYDWYTLDQDDTDLSGSGPLIIDAPSMTPTKLALAQGKDGTLYLTKRDDLGGIATKVKEANVGALQVQSGEISNGGAWATIGGTTYVVVRPNGTDAAIGCPNGTSGDLVAVKLDPAAPEKMSVAWCATSNGIGSPSITSSDGTSDPLVWVFGADPGGSGLLYAWDLTTGAPVLTSVTSVSGIRRFTTPIAVNGRVFVAGDGKVFAYAAK